jgi:hypothetical protein
MAQALTVIDPIPPLDVRRPAKFGMLPPWAQRRCDILKKASQPGKDGIHREVPVLPANLILGQKEKRLIERHLTQLNDILRMTPEENIGHGELTLTTISKMTMVLPSRESGDLVGEAKGEAYMAALEDVPCWAVQEAMRKWHRAEYGPKHDYKWQPAPATLRELSMTETYRVMAVARKLNDLLLAEPEFEMTPEQESRMIKKTAKYLKLQGV